MNPFSRQEGGHLERDRPDPRSCAAPSSLRLQNKGMNFRKEGAGKQKKPQEGSYTGVQAVRGGSQESNGIQHGCTMRAESLAKT